MTIRPTPPTETWIGETPAQIAYIRYVHDLARYADHIEALHANQASTLMARDATIAELRSFNETQMGRIEALQEAKAIVDEELLERTRLVESLRNDIRIISDELDVEAKRRDWCDEYLTFTDRVNVMLAHGRLGPEFREYLVIHTYEVRVEGKVMARDDNDAHTAARRQYNGILEPGLFRIPERIELALNGEDRGELTALTYEHKDTEPQGPA